MIIALNFQVYFLLIFILSVFFFFFYATDGVITKYNQIILVTPY